MGSCSVKALKLGRHGKSDEVHPTTGTLVLAEL